MAAVDRRFFFRSAGCLAFIGVSGCLTPIAPNPAFESLTRPVLPQPQMSPDAVVLEVAVVRFGAASGKAMGEMASGERDGGERDGGGQLVEGVFWQAVDEQSLAVDIRRELRRNGFRVGVIRGALPEALRRRLDQQRSAAREIDPENEPGSLDS